jgi:hypothetical protein
MINGSTAFMQLGINFPWIDYGWDFGPPPPEWVYSIGQWRTSKRHRIAKTLAEIANLGITSVRWFILGDGTNYGLGKEAPRLSRGQWHFDPLPAGHPYYSQMLDDFRSLLTTCQAHGLQLLPSLIDYRWAMPGVIPSGSETIVKGGRGSILTDTVKLEAFLSRVLDPLLDLSYDYREQIVAWELINEPEWVIRSPRYQFWRWSRQRTITKDRMRAFLEVGLWRINQYRGGVFRSTVGFAFSRSLVEWRSIGATLDQFHYYPASQEILPSGLESALVGEVATAAGYRPWPELKEQSIANRLALLESRGCSATYLWSAGDTSEATSWTAFEMGQVRQYLRERTRPAKYSRLDLTHQSLHLRPSTIPSAEGDITDGDD